MMHNERGAFMLRDHRKRRHLSVYLGRLRSRRPLAFIIILKFRSGRYLSKLRWFLYPFLYCLYRGGGFYSFGA